MSQTFEQFYTLPFLDDGEQQVMIRWVADLRLQRQLPTLLNQLPKQSESELARLLLQRLQTNPQNQQFSPYLFAYTARFIAAAVYRIKAELEVLNRISDSQSFFKDLYQITLESVSNPSEFYKNYQLDRTEEKYWLPSLKAYIRRRIEGMLCDRIRTMEGLSTYKRSSLGLAVRSTKKQVTDALRTRGYQDPQLAEYILMWQCFQELRPGFIGETSPQKLLTSQASNPNQALLQAVANRFNQLCPNLSIESSLQLPVMSSTAETWLKEAGEAIRHYLDPQPDELDRPRGGDPEAESSYLQERVRDPKTEPSGGLSPAEVSSELDAFSHFLHHELAELTPEAERVPLFLHGVELVQKEIGIELDKNQSTVGRQYKKILQRLLERLATWAKNQQGASLDSELLAILKNILVELLADYYGSLVDSYIRQSLEAQLAVEQKILRLYYACDHDLGTITDLLGQSATQLQGRLDQSIAHLCRDLQSALEARIQYSFKLNGPAQAKLLPLTEARLVTAPYPLDN